MRPHASRWTYAYDERVAWRHACCPTAPRIVARTRPGFQPIYDRGRRRVRVAQ